MSQHEERIAELQREGFELYHRCEQWKKALERIQGATNDPLILQIIKQTLRGYA